MKRASLDHNRNESELTDSIAPVSTIKAQKRLFFGHNTNPQQQQTSDVESIPITTQTQTKKER